MLNVRIEKKKGSEWLMCSVTVASLLAMAASCIGLKGSSVKEEVVSVPPSLLTWKDVIFFLIISLPELWVRHACSSATPPMPFLGSTSPQCEYLSLIADFIYSYQTQNLSGKLFTKRLSPTIISYTVSSSFQMQSWLPNASFFWLNIKNDWWWV